MRSKRDSLIVSNVLLKNLFALMSQLYAKSALILRILHQQKVQLRRDKNMFSPKTSPNSSPNSLS